MIDEKEKKMIQRYCVLPKIALTSMIMVIILGVVFLINNVINDVILESNSFETTLIGTRIYVIFSVIYLILFTYSSLSTIFGMRRSSWRNIVNKVSAEKNNIGDSGQIASFIGLSSADISNKMASNAKIVAKVCNVEIPKARKYVVPLIVIPILILTAIYIPSYVRTIDNRNNEKEVVSETIYKLQSAFENKCERVTIDDPYEKYQTYGYDVDAYYDDKYENHISITVSKNGNISQVFYYGFVDMQKSKEENIKNVEEIYAQLHKILINSGVELSNNIRERYTLSEEFKEGFMKASYDEEYYLYGEKIDFYYHPNLEFKLYEPYIYMSIK